MEKVKITLVVPERIAALVQIFLQREILVGGNSGLMFNLLINGVENPGQYLSEMEIGIEHPDDEPVKIASYWTKEHIEAKAWIEKNYFPKYNDRILDEDLYGIDLDDDSLTPPQYVVDFIESVKATDCSYFRFVNS